jgi:hypothetical protein
VHKTDHKAAATVKKDGLIGKKELEFKADHRLVQKSEN